MTAVTVGPVEADAPFAFDEDSLAQAEAVIQRYPQGKQASALLPLLHLAQRQNGGWLPRPALDYVANFLSLPAIRVYEVATFYTMYNLKPVGRHHVQVCTNLPCLLRGAGEIIATCRRELGIDVGGTTEDKLFTLSEAECLGACVNAPMLQLGDDYYEDLTPETTLALLRTLKEGERPKPGSQSGRVSCEPAKGLTTLTSLPWYAGIAGKPERS